MSSADAQKNMGQHNPPPRLHFTRLYVRAYLHVTFAPLHRMYGPRRMGGDKPLHARLPRRGGARTHYMYGQTWQVAGKPLSRVLAVVTVTRSPSTAPKPTWTLAQSPRTTALYHTWGGPVSRGWAQGGHRVSTGWGGVFPRPHTHAQSSHAATTRHTTDQQQAARARRHRHERK